MAEKSQYPEKVLDYRKSVTLKSIKIWSETRKKSAKTAQKNTCKLSTLKQKCKYRE